MTRKFVSAAGVLGLLAVFGSWFFFSTEAQRNTPTRYEYAVILGTYAPYPPDGPTVLTGAANICYVTPTGCQNEELKAEIIIAKFIQDEKLENSGRVRAMAQERAFQSATARAIAKLGNEGWQMVESPLVEFDLYYTNQQGMTAVKEAQKTERQHIWFIRARQ